MVCLLLVLLPMLSMPSLSAADNHNNYLTNFQRTHRPFGVVIGGAKVKDKIQVLHSLIHKADVLCIGRCIVGGYGSGLVCRVHFVC